MKAIILFHSVCGNTYLMAKEYEKSLKNKGIDVDLFRVRDDNYENISQVFDCSREFRSEILDVKVFENPHELCKYDLIFMGSPTYFGNVSSQIKTFMDSCADLWPESKLRGKYFGSFSSSGTVYGGSTSCLNAMNIFAQHMGMIILSVPSIVNFGEECSYGIAHASGHEGDLRIGETKKDAIKEYINMIPIFNIKQ